MNGAGERAVVAGDEFGGGDSMAGSSGEVRRQQWVGGGVKRGGLVSMCEHEPHDQNLNVSSSVIVDFLQHEGIKRGKDRKPDSFRFTKLS